jgi:hypothetical protein
MKIFSVIILISALALATVAALFSVTGIGYLFAGSLISVMAMAVTLEIGKLVSASFLYRHWKSMSKLLRVYMFIGTLILMGITSAGIYGYLSRAYATVASGPQQILSQVAVLESQKIQSDSDIYRLQKHSDDLDIRRTKQETRIDSAGLSGVRSLAAQNRLAALAAKDYSDLRKEISTKTKTSDSLSAEVTKLQNGVAATTELGPFLYIAKALGLNLDTAVNWFIVIIVLVFDPMSISLFLAYNTSISVSTDKEADQQNPETPEDDKFRQRVAQLKQKITNTRLETTSEDLEPVETKAGIDNPENDQIPQEPVQNQVPSSANQSGTDEIAPLVQSSPAYMEPDFDWDDETKWRNDIGAVMFRRYNTLKAK